MFFRVTAYDHDYEPKAADFGTGILFYDDWDDYGQFSTTGLDPKLVGN
jgi:hypothetical protein